MSSPNRFRRIVALLRPSRVRAVAGVVAAALLCGTANSAEYVVQNLNDAGAGSLRAALDAANASAADDVVRIRADLSSSILLTSALRMGGQGKLTVIGTPFVSINAQRRSAVVYVPPGTVVQLDDLYLRRGYAATGGGIQTFGTLTLNRVRVEDSEAYGAIGGGGIFNGGNLTINGGVLRNNLGSGSAGSGGLYNRPSAVLVVNGTGFVDNLTDGSGGAIHNARDAGTGQLGDMRLTDARILNNFAAQSGGGVYNGGAAFLVRTVLSGNRAGVDGGGIQNVGLAYNNRTQLTLQQSVIRFNQSRWGGAINSGYADVWVRNSTLAGNLASAGGAVHAYLGNLVFTNATITANRLQSNAQHAGAGLNINGANVNIINSIIAGNEGAGSADCLRQAGAISVARSIVRVGLNCATYNHSGFSADPMMAYGDAFAPLPYYRLLPGSPAIDAGDNGYIGYGMNPDQIGGVRIVGPRVDLGAVEVQHP